MNSDQRKCLRGKGFDKYGVQREVLKALRWLDRNMEISHSLQASLMAVQLHLNLV